MADISFLTEYMVPVIIGLCLCVGYVVKHWVKDVDNKIIPTLCAVLGVVLAVWMHLGEITPQVILSGLTSGLASTGLHQAAKQLFNKTGAPIIESVDAETLTAEQLREIALQMGLEPPDGATRDQLLQMLFDSVE